MKILNIRVEESVKNEIELLASEEGISPSEYARNILNDYLGYDNEDRSEVVDFGTINIDCSVPFHKDQQFIFLVSWLFSRGMYSYAPGDNTSLSSIKMMIEKAMNDFSFSNELRFEFLKVLNDINRCLFEANAQGREFYFCQQGNMYTFDYSILINEVLRIFNTN